MIDFSDWFRQIVDYAKFVLDSRAIAAAWIDGDSSRTSAVSFDEFYEQIFDDLDSAKVVQRAEQFLLDEPGKRDAVRAFVASIEKANEHIKSDSGLRSPEALLSSKAWKEVVNAAGALLKCA